MGFSPLFGIHQKRYMEYFQRTADHRGIIAMGSVRIIQSMQLAVTLMAVENFNLDATLEMRGDAAMDSTAGGDPLWVVAGLPVGDREPAYMTIAHRSEGPRADCAVCPDGDHVSAIICLGRTWVQRSCRRAGVAPRVVTFEEDVAARRIYPARVTQQPGMEVTTGLQGALRRWSILGSVRTQ